MNYSKEKNHSTILTSRSAKTRILRNGVIGKCWRCKTRSSWKSWSRRRKMWRCSFWSFWDCLWGMMGCFPVIKGTYSIKSCLKELITLLLHEHLVGHYHQFHWSQWRTVSIMETTTLTITFLTLNKRKTPHKLISAIKKRQIFLCSSSNTSCPRRVNWMRWKRRKREDTRNSYKLTNRSLHLPKILVNWTRIQRCKIMTETNSISFYLNNTNQKSEIYGNFIFMKLPVHRTTIQMKMNWQISRSRESSLSSMRSTCQKPQRLPIPKSPS